MAVCPKEKLVLGVVDEFVDPNETDVGRVVDPPNDEEKFPKPLMMMEGWGLTNK